MSVNPSPLRKILPPLVWPAGILLLIGYCVVGDRMEERGIAPVIREEIGDAPREVSVSGQLPLVVILAIVLVVLAIGVIARTNARDRAERQRGADESR